MTTYVNFLYLSVGSTKPTDAPLAEMGWELEAGTGGIIPGPGDVVILKIGEGTADTKRYRVVDRAISYPLSRDVDVYQNQNVYLTVTDAEELEE